MGERMTGSSNSRSSSSSGSGSKQRASKEAGLSPRDATTPAAAAGRAAAAAAPDDEAAGKRLAAAAAEDLRELTWRSNLCQEAAAAAAAAAGDVAGTEAGRLRGRGTDKNFGRITKLLNRIKHLTDKDSSTQLVEELRCLNLSLFLSELADGLAEADLKPSALKAATEIAVELSLAYADFPALFTSALERNVESLMAAFAASAEAVPASASSFSSSSCLLPPDAAAKQQQLGSRLRLLLRFLTDLLLIHPLPLSLEPLLLQLFRFAAAVPPQQQQQQQQQGLFDSKNEAAWPALSAAQRPCSPEPAAADAARSDPAVAAAGVPQGKWLYSSALCLCRLQALGGAFCRKAAQLLLTQQQQQERLAAAVSSSLKRQAASGSPAAGSQQTAAGGQEAAAAEAAGARDNSLSAAADPLSAAAQAAGGAAAGEAAAGSTLAAEAVAVAAAGEGLHAEVLSFESLTPPLVARALEAEGLSLADAEAGLAALRLPSKAPSPACRAELLAVLGAFFSSGCLPVLHAVQRELLQQEVKNLQQAVDRGVVTSENVSRLHALSDKFKGALVHAAALAELLQLPPPDAAELERAAAATVEGSSLLLGVTRLNRAGAAAAAQGGAAAASVSFGIHGEDDPAWRTKEERLFYTELLDLSEVLPAGLLGGREAKEEKAKAAAGAQAATKAPTAAAAAAASSSSEENTAAAAIAAATTAAAPPTAAAADAGVALAAFLARLPHAVTQQQIDQLAVDFFLERLNTKPNRTALAKALLHAPRTQLHLLPAYARLLAILRKPFKEETGQVLDALQADLKRFLEEHDPEKIESKIKCIRFVSECTKFRLFPPGLLLNAMNSLLEDLTPHRVEMLSHLAAGCGYFLLHSPLTGERFKGLISRMLRLSAVKHLPPEQECLLQDVYYQLCGSESKEAAKKQPKETLQLFIEHLLFNQLYGSEEEAEEVATLCRKLPWSSSPEAVRWFRDCLLELGDHTNFELIYRHAALLSALAKYIPGVVISCEDSTSLVFSRLRFAQFGLERENPEDAPQRLLQARLLGELYNYRLVDSSVLFDALYNLIGFGGLTAFQAGNIRTTHRLLFEGARSLQQQQQQQQQQDEEGEKGWAAAAVYAQLPLPLFPPPTSPVDPPDSTTRVKMVLQILEASGKYFNSGKARLKLNRFILFFERHCRHKAETGRVDWGEIDDVLRRLRPHRQQLKTAAAADAAAAKLLQEEARILQSLGEGPVEDLRDETALYGDSDGSEAAASESVAGTVTPQQQQGEEETADREEKQLGDRKTNPESDQETEDSFDAEFAAAMEEAAEEVQATRGSAQQQQPVRLPWGSALKELLQQSSRGAAAEDVPGETGSLAAAAGCSQLADSEDADSEAETQKPSQQRTPFKSMHSCEHGFKHAGVTLRLLQRRPEKRGKVQLKSFTVCADIALLQQQQEQQQQLQQRSGVERYVLESVMGVAGAACRKHAGRSKAARVHAANARIPGLAAPPSDSKTRGPKKTAAAAAAEAEAGPDAAGSAAAPAAAAAAAAAGGDRRSN
ncbi:hypothetical protein Efla_003274 [Eimeria flavescens]